MLGDTLAITLLARSILDGNTASAASQPTAHSYKMEHALGCPPNSFSSSVAPTSCTEATYITVFIAQRQV